MVATVARILVEVTMLPITSTDAMISLPDIIVIRMLCMASMHLTARSTATLHRPVCTVIRFLLVLTTAGMH
jgi:hypothetical protein